jgi:hypothetical protein
MKAIREHTARLCCLGLGLFCSSALAQQPPPKPAAEPGFHRMEIYNGATRTVHYVPAGASAADQTRVRDRERAENDAALADDLAMLRRQYVRDESFLQNRRTNVQQLFYGYSNQIGGGYYPGWGWGGYLLGYLGYGYGYPYFGFGVGASNSLMWGVGDEGVIKRELARTLAGPSAPPPGNK